MTHVQPPPSSRNLTYFQRRLLDALTIGKVVDRDSAVREALAILKRDLSVLSDAAEMAPHFDAIAVLERLASTALDMMSEPDPRDEEPAAEAMQGEAA